MAEKSLFLFSQTRPLTLPGNERNCCAKMSETKRTAWRAMLGAVTLSIGIAMCPDNGDSAGQLLKTADDALYRAKEAGRDRVISRKARVN